MGKGRKVYKDLVGNTEGKRPLGRPMRRWEDGINLGLKEVGWGVCIELAWLRIRTFGGLL
jgi:hypothetical protein